MQPLKSTFASNIPAKLCFLMTHATRPDLFGSVARVKPKLHCFGHVHNGWGAKMAAWREKTSEKPTYFSDIDHGFSTTNQELATLKRVQGKEETDQFCTARYRESEMDPKEGTKTLFVNAAAQGENGLDQMPWVLDVVRLCKGPPAE